MQNDKSQTVQMDTQVATSPLVLVIDDDTQVRNLITLVLESNDINVITATNGDEGCRLFEQHKPQLVITDIIMPEKEGVEVIMTLRRSDTNVPIIAISGAMMTADKGYLDMAKKLGASSVINKPFRTDDLVDEVRSLLHM